MKHSKAQKGKDEIERKQRRISSSSIRSRHVSLRLLFPMQHSSCLLADIMCVYINQKNRITVPKPAFDPLPLSSPSYRIYVISELVAIYRSYVHGRFCSMVVHAFTTNATHLYLEPIQDEKRVLSQYQHIRGYLFRLSGFVLATRQYDVFRI